MALIQITSWIQEVVLILLVTCALKHLIGFHFPWEKCECCGKKWGEHKNSF